MGMLLKYLMLFFAWNRYELFLCLCFWSRREIYDPLMFACSFLNNFSIFEIIVTSFVIASFPFSLFLCIYLNI